MSEEQNEAAEAKPPKGRFVFGCVTGGVLMLVLQVLIFVVAFLVARPNLADNLEAKLRDVDVPIGQIDYSWEVLDADGETVTLEPLRGQFAVIRFWKPGCPACEAELHSIEALADEVSPYGVQFAMICATESDEYVEKAAEMGMTLPVYGRITEIPEPLTPHTAPTTFVIDPEGNIVFKRSGSARWDTDEATAFFERVIAGG